MLGFSRWYLFGFFAAMLCIVAMVCVALSYFIPAVPLSVTLATGFKGSSFEAFGRRYQEILARSHVELTLRETSGALENLKLLQDPDSGVAAALVTGGISNGKEVPGVLSLGLIDNNPFWIFYMSEEPLERLSQLQAHCGRTARQRHPLRGRANPRQGRHQFGNCDTFAVWRVGRGR